MIGDASYWFVLLLGAAWASCSPTRWREAGLGLLAFALVANHEPRAAVVFLAAAASVWWLVRQMAGGTATAVAIIALATALVGSEIVQQFGRGHWARPLGLSYLVFRLINVLVDARRKAWERQPGWAEFCHFLFTPALFVAGPLERWGHWERPVTADRGTQVATGVWRIVGGLLKKLYLADAVVPWLAASFAWTVPSQVGAGTGAAGIWQACLFAYVQIYLEFSGYSDIAVGAALLWSRRPVENFNWPVLASTPADFWRRWHISMAQWCSNCIYLPVMGLVRGVVLPMLASFVVMGLWHGLGWNRVGWAVWQVAGLIVFIAWQRRLGRPKPGSWRAGTAWRLASIGLTQAFVIASYVFMLSGETVPLGQSLRLLARMFGWTS